MPRVVPAESVYPGDLIELASGEFTVKATRREQIQMAPPKFVQVLTLVGGLEMEFSNGYPIRVLEGGW